MRSAACAEAHALAHERQPAVEKLHAALDVAAVIPAESQHARGHARAQRRAGGGGVARGQRRRRRGAVIDERDEQRFHQPAHARRRDLADEQQVDRFAERQPAHDLVERVAADEDLVRLDARQRRAPLVAAVPAWRRRPVRARSWRRRVQLVEVS